MALTYRYLVCKIADFGLTRKVEAGPHVDNRDELAEPGTNGYRPPEQITSENGYRSNGCLPHIGKAMNIWRCTHFMFRGRNFTYSDRFYFQPKAASLRDSSSPSIPDYGEAEMRNPVEGPTRSYGQLLLTGQYSGTLRSIILRRLAYDWRHRPSASQLIKLANDAIAEFQRLEIQSQDDLAAAAEAAESAGGQQSSSGT
ncbi:hypothetical protein B0J14DRAFT_700908 [Halenospora varia]|nr:hypothetical protein B0J14DRAFT_700908 [Halenospora varia]